MWLSRRQKNTCHPDQIHYFYEYLYSIVRGNQLFLSFRSFYKGNIPLSLSIILLDTFCSPLVVPFTLLVFFQTSVEIHVIPMMTGLLGMIVLPSCIGMLLNQVTKGKSKLILSPYLAPFSKVGMALIVMINGAVVAPYISNVNLKLMGIGVTVFCIATTGYLVTFLISNQLKFDTDTTVALTFTGGMRNISAGAVLAVTYFPPAVAVPVVIAMLFQQVLASIIGVFLKRYYNRNLYEESQIL